MNVSWHVTSGPGVFTAHSIASVVRGQRPKTVTVSRVDWTGPESTEQREKIGKTATGTYQVVQMASGDKEMSQAQIF